MKLSGAILKENAIMSRSFKLFTVIVYKGFTKLKQTQMSVPNALHSTFLTKAL